MSIFTTLKSNKIPWQTIFYSIALFLVATIIFVCFLWLVGKSNPKYTTENCQAIYGQDYIYVGGGDMFINGSCYNKVTEKRQPFSKD